MTPSTPLLCDIPESHPRRHHTVIHHMANQDHPVRSRVSILLGWWRADPKSSSWDWSGKGHGTILEAMVTLSLPNHSKMEGRLLLRNWLVWVHCFELPLYFLRYRMLGQYRCSSQPCRPSMGTLGLDRRNDTSRFLCGLVRPTFHSVALKLTPFASTVSHRVRYRYLELGLQKKSFFDNSRGTRIPDSVSPGPETFGMVSDTLVPSHAVVESPEEVDKFARVIAAAFSNDALNRYLFLGLESRPDNPKLGEFDLRVQHWLPIVQTRFEKGALLIHTFDWAAAALW